MSGPEEKAMSRPTSDAARRRFDWNLLHSFLVIVEERSITRAAQRLLMQQPSLSNALKRLEEQLGCTLIRRGGGQFALTPQGQRLYRECQDICGTLGGIESLLTASDQEIVGHLRLFMASHVVFPPFDSSFARFHEAHPRVTFEIEITSSVLVTEAVLSKKASFGICLVHQPHPRLSYRRLFREHFGFFAGPRHRLFGRGGLTVEDLRGENFVSFNTDRLSDALRPVAILRATRALEGQLVGKSTHLEEVRRMIIAGLGIGPLPIHAVERDVRDGLLWRLPPYEDPPAVDIYLVTNPRTHLSEAEQLFLDLLTAQLPAAPDGHFVYPKDWAMAV